MGAVEPDAPGRSETLERVTTDRGELVLRRVGDHLEVISNGMFLMDTRDGRSERLLVRAALDLHPAPVRVLIGGLGVGFSLTEALSDPRVQHVTVVEIEPTLVAWHAGHLARFSAGALDHPRVKVVVGDVADHLRQTVGLVDVIALDVDNGPTWTVTVANGALYDEAGVAAVLDRLAPGGVLTVWSAHNDRLYEARLRRHAGDVRVLTVDVPRGEPDVVYLARKPVSS